MIQFTVERVVRAGPAEVYAWFADYSNRDYTGPDFIPDEKMNRAVMEQDETHAIFSDHYTFVDLAYRAEKHPPTSIAATGAGKRMNGTVVSTITPTVEGAKLVIEFSFEPRGGAKLMAALMKGHIEKAHIRHVDAFLKDFYAGRDKGPGASGAVGTV